MTDSRIHVVRAERDALRAKVRELQELLAIQSGGFAAAKTMAEQLAVVSEERDAARALAIQAMEAGLAECERLRGYRETDTRTYYKQREQINELASRERLAREALQLAAPDRAAVLRDLRALQIKCKERGEQIARMRDEAARRNRQLDALHYVWCSGGCGRGAHRFTPDTVTREVVEEAIYNTRRLARHYVAREARAGRDERRLYGVFLRDGSRANTLAGVVELEAKLVETQVERDEARAVAAKARSALGAMLASLPRCTHDACARPATTGMPVPEAGNYCDAHAPDGYDQLPWAEAVRLAEAL